MSYSEMVPNRGHLVLAVTTALLVVSSIFVFFRFVSRIGIVKRVGLDDYFILLAWARLIAFGFSFSICYGTSVGLGRHEVDVPPQWQSALKKSEYAFSVLYNPALMATKTSILLFYLGLTKEEPVFRWASYSTLFVVNAAGLALTFLNIFQCRPVGASFENPISTTASCTDIVTLYLSSAPVNIITDLAIFFLPMPILTGMRLPRKQKIILIVTFSFGAFVAVVDVVRIAYLQNASLARLQEVGKNNGGSGTRIVKGDFSWYASLSFMWSAVEVNVGIICACVPSLKPLVFRFLPSMLRDSDDISEKSGLGSNSEHTTDLNMAHAQRLPSFVNGDMHSPITPTKKEPSESTGKEGGEVGFLEFLSGPDTDAPMSRTNTAMTGASHRGSMTFFDFVNMKKPKSMLKLSARESIFPIALTTILFFLWGFAYGLLAILNSQFQVIVHMSTGESLGLHAAYFGGYFFGPLTVGRTVLKRWGFKATFVTGLCIYGCGTLIFWPSAVLTSYVAFVISNFIVGFGLSTLEVAANPFIALCGPMEYAELRLNISQGFQAIGSVVSPLLAQKVLFKNVLDAPSLIDVQWAYLGIAFFDVLLAVAFHYLPIPEASDEDLEDLAVRRRAVNTTKVGGAFVVWVTLAFGVFSQFCYVGGQEAMAGEFLNYVPAVKPNSKLTAFDYQTIGHAVFAIGRFLSAFAQFFFKPRWILLFLYIGLIVTSILAMNLTGYAGITMLILTYFFESGVFSIIFAICLRGTGAHTKTASAFMTAAISGGAIFPVIQSPVSTAKGVRYSYCVVVAVYAFGTIFPAYLNLVPAAKKQVDPVPSSHHHHSHHHHQQPRPQSSGVDPPTRKGRFGAIGGIVARRKKGLSAESPTTDHHEGDGKVAQLVESGEASASGGPSTPTHPRGSVGGGGGGIAHDLAPWPDSTPNSPTKDEKGGLAHDLAPWPT